MNNHKLESLAVNMMPYCLLLNPSKCDKVEANTTFKMSLSCLRIRTAQEETN